MIFTFGSAGMAHKHVSQTCRPLHLLSLPPQSEQLCHNHDFNIVAIDVDVDLHNLDLFLGLICVNFIPLILIDIKCWCINANFIISIKLVIIPTVESDC